MTITMARFVDMTVPFFTVLPFWLTHCASATTLVSIEQCVSSM